MPVAGLLTDRIGARKVLAAGALVIGLGNLALSRFESLGELRFFMACMGPGQAAVGAVAASALVLRLFRHRRGLAIGILNGGDNLINSARADRRRVLSRAIRLAPDDRRPRCRLRRSRRV